MGPVMPSVKVVRARKAGWCASEFAHPGAIVPGDIVCTTTYFPRDEHVMAFGVPPFARFRRCQWCVLRDDQQYAERHGVGILRYRDRQGDVWRFERDGMLHTRETAPFSWAHVQRKWGPLAPHSSERESDG